MNPFDNFDITSSNSVAVLIVDTLFPAGIELQKFSTDQSISSDDIQLAETRMGVDGRMAAGFVPAIYPVTIVFEANSPSIKPIDTVAQTTKTLKKVFPCKLIITVPSVKKVYTYTGGVLKNWKGLPDLKKVLDPLTAKFDFEKLTIVGI